MSRTPELKGSSFTLSVLHLSDESIQDAKSYLMDKVAQAPAFFEHAPVVINLSQVTQEPDFTQLKQAISSAGMIPVGITGCKDKRMQTLAAEAGFAIMSASKSPSQAPAPIPTLKVVRTPVRSGQQIYAKNGDLLVLGHVSAGAEVIADGSIHIHGTLRGRAIAGASGQQDARILCHDLQAELISIAGSYWLSDQIDPNFWQKKVMLSMAEEQLLLEALTL
ncbi:septum site-determining protein MinC [Vibrio sp. SM6]|uniref:Probable septum site-determining protein MinC n=1 Tax=Vibrio agarilyticus TaxID=2726741 RepID=A0A7X8TMN2_9VIBR|nr:septum site-determining protein MinC [Vibrio agarilyticus]NLS11555.1 septum site-determining protein MinC [Vibrio agarilyticus]